MMAMFHRLEFRVHAHATEDEARVRQALDFATGGAEVEETVAEGHHGNPIRVLQASLGRPAEIRAFFARLPPQDIERLVAEADRRLDDDLFFHLRLDKQEAYRGRLALADHDDVIAVRGKVASFPARRERALPGLVEYLQGLGVHAANP
jgi:RNA binding exosome subunit